VVHSAFALAGAAGEAKAEVTGALTRTSADCVFEFEEVS
jgi:hypothetical protein